MNGNIPDNDERIYHKSLLCGHTMEHGIKYMNETQILDMLLLFSAPRSDTEKSSKELMNRYDGLESLISAPEEKLAGEGLSDVSICLLKMLPAVTERYYKTINSGLIYSGSADKLKAFFKPLFLGLGHEEIRIVCFDSKYKMTENTVISKGNVYSVIADVRTFLDTVVQNGAEYVAFAHNHPGGSSAPSHEDIKLTSELKKVLESLDMKFIDHLIVGRTDVYSMRESMYDKFFGK